MAKKLRNLAPMCFESSPVLWGEEERKEIDKIIKKYNIQNDLSGRLAQLPTEAASFVEIQRQTPSPKEIHDTVNQIHKKLQELETLLELSGTRVTSLIAKNTHDSYATFGRLKGSLRPLIDGCEKTKYKLPKIKRGRHRDPFKLAIIQYLINIYVQGTGKEPTCGWLELNKSHIGECYEFLTDLNSFILKKLQLYFDSEGTIGQYLHEALKYRNEKLAEAHSMLLFCLSIKGAITTLLILPSILWLETAFLILEGHPQAT